MKNFTKLSGLFFLIVFSLLSKPAQATHIKGMDVYFVCLGGGQYELVFSEYFACENTSIRFDSIAADYTWAVSSTCGTIPTSITATTATISQDVPYYCPGVLTTCDYWNGSQYSYPVGTPQGTAVITFTSAPFSIPAGCTVTASMTVSARNQLISNISNPGGDAIDATTTITTPADSTCSNNPVFASYPVDVFCVNENQNFSQVAIDLSGDSLTYTLVDPASSGGVPVTWVSPCSARNPMGAGLAGGFASLWTFDSTTGNINFTPTTIGDYVFAVLVNAYQNGVLVGTTRRDLQFNVINCATPPAIPNLTSLFSTANVTGATVIDSNHLGVCPGETMSINLVGTLSDSFNYVLDTTNAAISMPGATVTVTHAAHSRRDTAFIHITWTPNGTDSGFHYFFLTLSDTVCPLPGRRSYAFVVSVLSGVYAGPSQVYCNGGAPVTIYATGSNHYVWTDSATGGPAQYILAYGPDSSWITVDPPVSTGYVVHGDLLGSCRNTDTAYIKNAPLFSLVARATDSTICKYTTTTLYATPNPLSVGPFTYQWSPASTLVAPTADTTATHGLTSNVLYYVTATAIGGCAIRDSVPVTIRGAAPKVHILPSNNNVCPGDTINLHSIVFAENLAVCGIDTHTCNIPGVSTVTAPSNPGTGLSSGTSYPNEYCTPFAGTYNAAKVQYLFRASELQAMGVQSGAISNLAFFVTQLNSTLPYDTFTVMMGCTNLDSLATFDDNLTTVAGPLCGSCAAGSAYFPNTGWSPIPFNSGVSYGWDGVSNLVVQVCYHINNAAFSTNDYVAYTPTTFAGSTIYNDQYYFDAPTTGCGQNYATGFYYGTLSARPVIQFTECVPDNLLSYHWSPSSLPCHTCDTTSTIVTGPQTDTLTVSFATCSNDTVVNLNVSPYLASHVPDTTLCAGSCAKLQVELNNQPPFGCVTGYSVDTLTYSAITGTGTTLPPVDFMDQFGTTHSTDENGTAGPFNIGFNFPFYCQTFNQFYVNCDGWVTFEYPYTNGQGSWEYTATSLPPASSPPVKAIELLMGGYYLADGFGGGRGNVKYFVNGTAPNRILVIVFTNMEDAALAGTSTSGEIHLHETSGIVDILIKSSTYTGVNHTTGLVDTAGIGTAAPQVNNVPYTVAAGSPKAWRFTPQYGAPAQIISSLWSPNVSITGVDSLAPLVCPTGNITYTVQSNMVINQFTNPAVCKVYDTVHVSIDSFRITSITVSPNPICPGDTANITSTTHGGTVSTYTWTPATGLSSTTIPDPSASVLDTTWYHLTAIDLNICRAVDSLRLDILPVQHPVIGPSQTVCYNDSVKFSLPTGSYSNYQWYSVDTATGVRTLVSSGPADSTFYAHPAGSYVLEVTSSSGAACPYFTNIVSVDSYPVPVITVDTNGFTTFCQGQNVVLSVNPGYNNIMWTPSSYGTQNSITISTTGVYSYSATDAHNCVVYSNAQTVTVNPIPVFILSNYKSPICSGSTDTINVSTSPAGGSVNWTYAGNQTSGNVIVAADSGQYSIQANVAGCVNDTTIALSVVANPSVSLGPDVTNCNCSPSYVLSPVVTPSAVGNTFMWSDSTRGTTDTDYATGSRIYTVTVTDVNGCTATAHVDLTFNCPMVTITVDPASDTIFRNDTAVLTAVHASGTVATSYVWGPAGHVFNPMADSVHAIGYQSGKDTFWVIASDALGCSDSVPFIVNVLDSGAYVVPDAFTPNSDGLNPTFYPVLQGGANSPAKVVAFRVYNRWGQLIWDNPTSGWDGSYGGKPQPIGTYLYFATFEFPDPTNAAKTAQKSQQGTFQLFR